MKRVRQPWHRRAAARVVTGPVAHGVVGTVSLALMVARYGWARARGHDIP